MVYNTDICIAYKDHRGLYKFEQVSIFSLKKVSNNFPIENFKRRGKNITIAVKCPICEEKHIFEYKINELIKREMIIGGCELANKPIFIFGKSMKVLGFIKKHNEINKEIYAML